MYIYAFTFPTHWSGKGSLCKSISINKVFSLVLITLIKQQSKCLLLYIIQQRLPSVCMYFHLCLLPFNLECWIWQRNCQIRRIHGSCNLITTKRRIRSYKSTRKSLVSSIPGLLTQHQANDTMYALRPRCLSRVSLILSLTNTRTKWACPRRNWPIIAKQQACTEGSTQ